MFVKHNPGLEGIKTILKLDLDGKRRGMRSQGYDRCIAICGEEGSGKSTLALHMLDIWYNEVLQKPEELTISKIPSNRKELAETLQEIKDKEFKYAMFFHDEAVKDLYRKDGITKFQKMMEVSYTVIRGLNLYSGWLIPSILDLSKMFRTRRIRGMYYVYARGKYAYYSKAKLKKLIPLMQQNQNFGGDPNPFDVRDQHGKPIRATCLGTFPQYKGPLANAYAERKEANMRESLQDMVDIAEGKEKQEEEVKVEKPKRNLALEYGEKIHAHMSERSINPSNKKLFIKELGIISTKLGISTRYRAKDYYNGYVALMGEKYGKA